MAVDLILGQTKRDWSLGSILFPAKEQRELFNKIDDVRFDIRNTKNVVGAGIFAASGALAFLAISSIYKSYKREPKTRSAA